MDAGRQRLAGLKRNGVVADASVSVPLAGHLAAVQRACGPFFGFLANSRWSRRVGAPGMCDFVVGNPHEPPLPAYVAAIREASVPRRPGWFGYTLNDPAARAAATASLRERLDIPYEEEDIFLTRGGSGALVLALEAILNPGDEVVYLSPPWFFYEAMIAFVRGRPVSAKVDPDDFDIDLDAVRAAITPRTRAVIVNSPNNPTGKIYPAATLRRLGELLVSASAAHGATIYLISDECYNRLVFDDAEFVSPTGFYPCSFLVYSYAKALLTPGQRLGYLAVAPGMPDRERLRMALLTAQYNNGCALPDAVLQHALPAIEPLCIDVANLQRRRDRLVQALRAQGYTLNVPEGAWYLLVESPLADDAAFADLLADEDVFVLPGGIVEMPGYFRISLTASDEMVERSIPAFAAAMAKARAAVPALREPVAAA
ncbi:MAG: aspartate aminotransferase [Sphingomonadales bacterium]|jgi:aspartate aminotransferase|nr:aspartate aminotransferase [Sphingomonadales bacterium]